MSKVEQSPGLYGKIPSLGDFVSRRLSPGFIDTWDAWLQRGMAASKEQLGPQWTEIYRSGPIWHFLLSAGVCGSTPWAGIMMPSVDKVGRYFPLTLAAELDPQRRLSEIFVGAGDWFQHMEALALSVLEDRIGIAELDHTLQTLGLPDPAELKVMIDPSGDQAQEKGHPVFSMALTEFEQMTEALAHIGYHRLTGSRSVFTLWRTRGSVSMKPCLRLYGNLPPMDGFSTLLQGHTKEIGPNTTPVRSQPTPDSVIQENEGQSPDIAPAGKGHPNHWSSCALSTLDSGKDLNGGAYLDRPEIGLWAVVDGGEGQRQGDTSCTMAIDALGILMPTGNLESYTAYATECLRSVNTDLFGMSDTRETSIVAMLAVGRRCSAIWAGNSRLYRFRNNTLARLTPGPSTGAEHGEVSPGNNPATCALGLKPDLACDQVSFEAESGDLYLLCSDGLVRAMNEQDIEAIMKQGQCRACTQGLIDLALERGAGDNATAVVSRVH